MARTIIKKQGTTVIHGFDPSQPFNVVDGRPQANVTIEVDGILTDAQATRALSRECGTDGKPNKNVMVLSKVISVENIALSDDVFFEHSKPCENGVTYPRSTTYVREFVITTFNVFDGNSVIVVWRLGKFSDSSNIRYGREFVDCPTAVVYDIQTDTVKRYMSKDKYARLATE